MHDHELMLYSIYKNENIYMNSKNSNNLQCWIDKKVSYINCNKILLYKM